MRGLSDPVRAIADAVLYEGYVLWPYRRSALKNAQRWTFGGVFPRQHAEARAAGDDRWWMQAQCLVEGGPDARVAATVRFLHVVRRQALAPGGRPIDALTDATGARHLSWDEAAERELALPAAPLRALEAGARTAPLAIPAGAARESLPGGGALERRWESIDALVHLRAEPLAPRLHRVTVRIENVTACPPAPRADVQRRTLCSTHAVLHLAGGAFVSLTDPPAPLRRAADGCVNAGAWPVLVGEPPARETLLCAPIILADYPRVAPESPGDLFDGGEIDQLLILNILALTDEEKAEARASDPLAREVLERTEALTPEQLMALHGTIRELQVRR